jgi:hypothetical protein
MTKIDLSFELPLGQSGVIGDRKWKRAMCVPCGGRAGSGSQTQNGHSTERFLPRPRLDLTRSYGRSTNHTYIFLHSLAQLVSRHVRRGNEHR